MSAPETLVPTTTPAATPVRANGRVGISVVVPVYNSSAVLAELVERLVGVLGELDETFELVFVDDCSPDDSWRTLESLHERHDGLLRIKRLLVNTGQHAATLLGLLSSRGDIVITMDDDLQHRPEDVPKLVAAIRSGHDLAVGSFEEKRHSRFRNLGGRAVDWLLRSMYGLPRDFHLTSFRAMTRHVVEAVRRVNVPRPYLTAMLLATTSNRVNVPVAHDQRREGATNYTLGRSLSLVATLVLEYSSIPIRLALGLCILSMLVAIGLVVWVFVQALYFGVSVPGWASTMVAISVFHATLLATLVLFGWYVSRFHAQLSQLRTPFPVADERD